MAMVDTKYLKYTKSHEWARLDGNTCVVGITDFAQKEIRDIVYVELPKIGKEVAQGSQAGMIESVKAAFEFYAPITGKIVAVNDKVAHNVTLVHNDPYGEGWLFKIETKDTSQLKSLMNEEEYAKMTSEAAH